MRKLAGGSKARVNPVLLSWLALTDRTRSRRVRSAAPRSGGRERARTPWLGTFSISARRRGRDPELGPGARLEGDVPLIGAEDVTAGASRRDEKRIILGWESDWFKIETMKIDRSIMDTKPGNVGIHLWLSISLQSLALAGTALTADT